MEAEKNKREKPLFCVRKESENLALQKERSPLYTMKNIEKFRILRPPQAGNIY